MRTTPHAAAQRSKQRSAPRSRKLTQEVLEDRLLLAQTTGLFYNDPGTSNGYVLMSPNATGDTYLINKDGEVVHEWSFNTQPGLLAYLQDDGSLVRASAAASGGQGGNGVINAAGAGGRIEWVEWDGTPRWSFDYGIANTATDSLSHLQHHDIEVLPNNNILMIAWEFKTGAEAIQAGRNPATVGTHLYPDHIVEVQPDLLGGGGTIVWEWHIWDHLIQDFDATKDNFGVVADHPEKIDINYTSIGDEGGGAADDWTHCNGIDYNPELDQIVLSSREFSEYWIIDHDTTTAEAAGPAGDLLYRWGNPQTYGRGDESDRVLYYQHDPKWVTDGAPGAGNITVFNNGYGGPANPDLSSVVEITPPVDQFGNYPTLLPGEAYGPATPTWTYTAAQEDFSSIISGTQRLDNGNTLITFGVDGTLKEVTPAGVEVWKYVNPYVGAAFDPDGVLGPEDPIPNFGALGLKANFVFRSIHYPFDFAPQLPLGTITERLLFYNNSGFDSNTPEASLSDYGAIDTTKSAYVAGQGGTVTGVNTSSYSKGLNGVIVSLTGPHGAITADDFTLRMSQQGVGANNTPSTWTAAPTPTVTVFSDTPVIGTDRIHLTWPDGSIVNRYLEVVVKGDDAAGGFSDNTGLVTSDIFFFANQVGDTFNDVGFFGTDATDEINTRNHQGVALSPTNIYDFNKDFSVDATDQIISRNNGGFMPQHSFANPPAAPTAGDDADDAAIAAALFVPADAPSRTTVAAARSVSVAPQRPPAAPARDFWQQLGEASDPRAERLLVALAGADEGLDFDDWLGGESGST